MRSSGGAAGCISNPCREPPPEPLLSVLLPHDASLAPNVLAERCGVVPLADEDFEDVQVSMYSPCYGHLCKR